MWNKYASQLFFNVVKLWLYKLVERVYVILHSAITSDFSFLLGVHVQISQFNEEFI